MYKGCAILVDQGLTFVTDFTTDEFVCSSTGAMTLPNFEIITISCDYAYFAVVSMFIINNHNHSNIPVNSPIWATQNSRETLFMKHHVV